MALNTTDIARLSRLLDEALALAPAQVEPWLAALAPDDLPLAPRLRAMLHDGLAHRDSKFLELGPRLDRMADAVARPGETVGPYRLLREIGRGGMGSVWLAERADGSYEREVALKLPRLAWGAGLAERMQRERDIGARLEHPAIARLYDAGVDASGRPYMAFEYIAGQPIDTWCRAHGLGVAAVLRLGMQVIRAVAYAHARRVVHRDLKPSNVLVTTDGRAHLLDFGIASLLSDAAATAGRATGADPARELRSLTQEHGRALTPHYASPEQIAGLPVTVQSDVYSLGVLLYELLTGSLPHGQGRQTPGAVEDAILNGDVPPATSRVNDKALARALRGDVSAILAKAMHRDPALRYDTADALAQDIDRHLNGEPVAARPDKLAYRLRKTLRRHRVNAIAAGAVLLALLAGSALALVQAQRASQAAERESLVKSYMAEVFSVQARNGAGTAAEHPPSVQAWLEQGGERIKTKFAGQPQLQSDMYGMVGGIYFDMGAYEQAADYLKRQVDTRHASHLEGAEQARVVLALAKALLNSGHASAALAQARQVLALAAPQSQEAVESWALQALAQIELGRIDEAQSAQQTALSINAQRGASASRGGAMALAAQARVLVVKNQMDAAIPVYQQAIAQAEGAEGHLSTTAVAFRLAIANALAETLSHATQAQQFFEPAAAALRELGGVHALRGTFETARFMSLRNQLVSVDSTDQILAVLNASRASLLSASVPVPPSFIEQVDYWIAVTKVNDGDIAGGLPLLDANAPALLKRLESANRRRRIATFYGRTLMFAGRHDEAAVLLDEALQARRASGLGEHPWAAINYRDVATNRLMQGRYADAERVLDSAPVFKDIDGEGMNPARYSRSLVWTRARLRLAQGRAAEALALLTQSQPEPGEHAEEQARFQQLHGEALCRAGQRAEGLQVLRATLAAIKKAEGHLRAPWWSRLQAVAGLCAYEAGHTSAAVEYAASARAGFKSQPLASPYYTASLTRLETALAARRGFCASCGARRVSQTAAPAVNKPSWPLSLSLGTLRLIPRA